MAAGEAVHLGFLKSLISLRLSFFDGTPMSLCPYRDIGGGLAAGASPPPSLKFSHFHLATNPGPGHVFPAALNVSGSE